MIMVRNTGTSIHTGLFNQRETEGQVCMKDNNQKYKMYSWRRKISAVEIHYIDWVELSLG